jgi:purine-nucleoside phosphorylase
MNHHRRTQKTMTLQTKPAATRIQRASRLRPTLAIVLGSGFQYVRDLLAVDAAIPYSSLRGFMPMGVKGHTGEVYIGRLSGTPVAVLSGRAHFYEGHTMERVTFPVRVLAALGVRDLLLTNAAGGINRRFRAGDFMLVQDHINFMGENPLRGPTSHGLARFVDMTHAYDAPLGALLSKAARRNDIHLKRGVYVAVNGPSYETPAEIRAFGKLGGDAVGMSTVPEVIVARQCGLNVAVLSCITNLAAGLGGKPLLHEDVLKTGQRVQARGVKLIRDFADLYGKGR